MAEGRGSCHSNGSTSFDPNKVLNKQLQAELDAQRGKTVSVEHAVFAYLQDQIARLGDNGTVSRTRTLLGDVRRERPHKAPRQSSLRGLTDRCRARRSSQN